MNRGAKSFRDLEVYQLALVKETAEGLLSLQTAGAREQAEISEALAEADADIAAGRLHAPAEVRQSLGL